MMRITEKQLIIMWGVFLDSCDFDDTIGGVPQHTREKVANAIMKQQSGQYVLVHDQPPPGVSTKKQKKKNSSSKPGEKAAYEW